MMFFAFLAQTLRIAMPYLFASAGGVASERSGLIALTLEGYMLIAAFCAALGSYFGGSPWMGIAAGAAGGVATALLYGLCSIRYRANQVVVGINTRDGRIEVAGVVHLLVLVGRRLAALRDDVADQVGLDLQAVDAALLAGGIVFF